VVLKTTTTRRRRRESELLFYSLSFLVHIRCCWIPLLSLSIYLIDGDRLPFLRTTNFELVFKFQKNLFLVSLTKIITKSQNDENHCSSRCRHDGKCSTLSVSLCGRDEGSDQFQRSASRRRFVSLFFFRSLRTARKSLTHAITQSLNKSLTQSIINQSGTFNPEISLIPRSAIAP
jgi:hypothetical protein